MCSTQMPRRIGGASARTDVSVRVRMECAQPSSAPEVLVTLVPSNRPGCGIYCYEAGINRSGVGEDLPEHWAFSPIQSRFQLPMSLGANTAMAS